MRTQKTFLTAMMVVIAVAFAACQKDNQELIPGVDETAIDQPVDRLVDHANTRYLAFGLDDGREDQPFLIPNDGLIDDYTANERGFVEAGKDAGNSFLLCLRSVEPDEDQVVLIRRALRQYEMRNARIIEHHRGMVDQLRQRLELQHRHLYGQYQNGVFTEEEYRTKRSELRQRFLESLQRIRENNALAFSRSYRLLLQQLNTTLSDTQWEDFVTCVRQ